jgi:hypothetical protein
MRIHFFTSDNNEGTPSRLLVGYNGKPYVVEYCNPDEDPLPNPVILLDTVRTDDVAMAFERFLKFALVPWYYFDEDFVSFDKSEVVEKTKKIIAHSQIRIGIQQQGEVNMERYNWEKLSHLQVGKYAEYYSKMEFTMHGFHVYNSEVDDHGIDFVVKGPSGNYQEVQVKSLREKGYIFIPKSKMQVLSDNRLISVVIFKQGIEPEIYLIPSTVWNNPNALFVVYDYGEGKKSQPEWGINLSIKNMPLLQTFKFHNMIKDI